MKSKDAKKSSSALKGILIVLIITAVLILSVFVITNKFGDISEQNVSDKTDTVQETELSANKRNTFPVSFSQTIKKIDLTSSCVYVLMDNDVTILQTSGKYVDNIVLNFIDPMIKTSDKYAIIYDRQGKSVRILGRKNVIFGENFTAEGQIITADICNNGNFILVTRHNDATSAVTYYSKTGEVLYQWLCKNEYVVCAGVSNNYRNIICAALSSKKGKIYTKAYYLDTNSADNNKEYTVSDCSPIDAFFTSGKKAAVVCNNKRFVLQNSKEETEPVISSYQSDILMRANDESGNTVIVTDSDESDNENVITIYNAENEIVLTKAVTEKIIDVACFGKRVYISTESAISRISFTGKTDTLVDLSNQQCRLSIGSKGIFYYTTSKVCCN